MGPSAKQTISTQIPVELAVVVENLAIVNRLEFNRHLRAILRWLKERGP